MNKNSLVMLSALLMSLMVVAKGPEVEQSSQVTEAQNYVFKQDSIDNKISTAEQFLQQKQFRVNDIQRALDSAKQEMVDAEREVISAKNELTGLETWYKNLPARSSDANNQVKQGQNYAVRKNSIAHKISTAERALQEKQFKVSDMQRTLEAAKQDVRDAELEVASAKHELTELKVWYRGLPVR
jgi:chromosome segregation ATPase